MRSIKDKIKTRQEVKEISQKLRNNNAIITTNGAFDILHIGHVESLMQAKRLDTDIRTEELKYLDHNTGSYYNKHNFLIVGINSDESVARYKPGRPVNKQYERAYMLANLECVDLVTIFNEDDPREWLSEVKPHFHVKSEEGYKGIEKEIVESNGGRIVLIPQLPGYSTTNLINKVTKSFLISERNNPRPGDGTKQQERYYRKGV